MDTITKDTPGAFETSTLLVSLAVTLIGLYGPDVVYFTVCGIASHFEDIAAMQQDALKSAMEKVGH